MLTGCRAFEMHVGNFMRARVERCQRCMAEPGTRIMTASIMTHFCPYLYHSILVEPTFPTSFKNFFDSSTNSSEFGREPQKKLLGVDLFPPIPRRFFRPKASRLQGFKGVPGIRQASQPTEAQARSGRAGRWCR